MGDLTDMMNAQNDRWYGPNMGPGGLVFPPPAVTERESASSEEER